MSMLRVFCCLSMLAFFGASSAQAANPSYDAGYPKPGTNVGEIDVKGSVNLGAGLTTAGGGTIIAIPVGGGTLKSASFNLPPNAAGVVNWGKDTIGGLTSGQEYWVVVQINVRMGTMPYTVATDPVKVKAK